MVESESSWKGHTFTLLVFGGIVVLCSIFFVLGMLVGRSQGQRIAEMAAADTTTHKNAAQPLPASQPLDFFNQTTQPTPYDTLQPRPKPAPEGSVPAAAPPAQPEPAAVPEQVADKTYWQITATKSSDEATDVLNKVKSNGYRARILSPGPESKDALYRVLVGPYDTNAEADAAKKDLQALGYKDVFRK